MSHEIPIRPQILIASLTGSLKGAARARRVARLTREREEREAARQRWNAWWAEFLQELRLSESDPPQTMALRTHDILALTVRLPVADRARIEALLRQRQLTELELSARYWSDRPDEAAKDLAGARQCNERGELTMDKREQLEFREHHTSGYPWQLQAWLSQVIIGHIRRGGDGVYRYHGELNELNADLSDTDLDRLKEKIQARGRR